MQQQLSAGIATDDAPSNRHKDKRAIGPPVKLKRINKLIRQIISNDRWNLSCKRITLTEIQYILSNTKTHHQNVSMLWLHWNQIPTVISLVNNYCFASLQIINVGGNNIESVENIQFNRFQNIQQLWLWNNKIVRIDCLRKCQFPALKFIDLSQNYILQCSKLYELKAPLLERINIEKNGFANLNHFAKILRASTNPIKILFMQNQVIKIFNSPLKRGKREFVELTFNRKQTPVVKIN